MAEVLQDSGQLESTTVKINRTAATVKGGRRMSFSALVVVGDRQGSVGIGYGKAPGVPAAIEKAQKDARLKAEEVWGAIVTAANGHPLFYLCLFVFWVLDFFLWDVFVFWGLMCV